MWRYMLLNLLLSVQFAPAGMSKHERKLNYTTEVGIDFNENVYVASDDGKPLKMATVAHCLEARFADDKQTVGCSVARGTKPEEAMQSLRMEIYLRNGKKEIIETETPMDWHFWRDGQQVAVYARLVDGTERYALYDSGRARLIEELTRPSDKTLL